MNITAGFSRKIALSLLVSLLVALFLTACGDEATPTSTGAATTGAATTGVATTGVATTAITTPVQGNTSPTSAAASSTTAGLTIPPLATIGLQTATPGVGTTTTVASVATGIPANNSQDVCRDSTAQAGPKPTSTTSVQATIPSLVYTGAKTLNATETTSRAILNNLNGPSLETIVGKFTGDKITFSVSTDLFDKIDAFYRKSLTDEGWQLFRSETDGASQQSILVYQKEASKIVISVQGVKDASGYPPEIAPDIKPGNTVILAVSGKAIAASAEPTPISIPGSPTAEIKTGQRKLAVIEMEKGGRVVIQLCPALAPKTVENFEKLATRNFYNGLTFHRIEKTPSPFVVQGGDPRGDGTGGPGYAIPDEFTLEKNHTRGTVAMAHSSAPNSGGSQFYICLDAAPFLDGKYSIFGQVIEGMAVVDQIAKGDKMKSITITVQ